MGAMCEESRRRVNVGLPCLLLCFLKSHCFTSSAAAPRGYKWKWSPLHTLMSSRIISRCLLVFFLALEKKERNKDRTLGLRERCLSFTLEPWQNKTGPPPMLRRSTCRTSWAKGSWRWWSSRPAACLRTLCPLHQRRDMWSPSWHFMSGDAVCHHTDTSAHCCSTIAWSCII
jgi:hypothetical protein